MPAFHAYTYLKIYLFHFYFICIFIKHFIFIDVISLQYITNPKQERTEAEN